jgi:hypothetical protein
VMVCAERPATRCAIFAGAGQAPPHRVG